MRAAKTVCGRLLGLFNNETQDRPVKLDVKSAGAHAEICIDFSDLCISPFKSSEEYGADQMIRLWQKIGLGICAGTLNKTSGVSEVLVRKETDPVLRGC